MRSYSIFDCTKVSGTAFRIFGPKWVAALAAIITSKVTGRFHDYDTDFFVSE